MSINNLYGSIFKNIQEYSTGNESRIKMYNCVLKKVYSNVTADVFVPALTSEIPSVNIIMPSFGNNQGAIFLPENGSNGIFVTTTDRTCFVLVSSAINNRGDIRKIEPNEVEIYSNGASIKETVAGDILFSSKDNLAHESMTNKGVRISSGIKKIEDFTSRKLISSFVNINNTKTAVFLEKIFTNINIPTAYNFNDISSFYEGSITINETIKSEILESANSIIVTATNFINDLQNYKASFNEIENSEIDEFKTTVSDLKNKLYNDYKIGREELIVTEKGVVFDKSIESLSDIDSMLVSDIAKDENGIDIIFRETFKKENENVAIVTMNKNGDFKIRCKSYNIIETQ